MKASIRNTCYKLFNLSVDNIASLGTSLEGNIINIKKFLGNVCLSNLKFADTSSRILNTIYVMPEYAFKYLEDLDVLDWEKVLYMEWYLNGFVSFYENNSFQDFLKCWILIETRILKYSFAAKQFVNINFTGLERVDNFDKEEIYTRLLKLSKSMKEDKEKGIPYLRQFDKIANFGINKDYLIRLLNRVNYEIDIPQEEKPVVKTLPQEEKEFVFKKNGVSTTEIKHKIEQYFDLSTLENKQIIEGELLEEIVSLVTLLGMDLPIRKIILENNEQIRAQEYDVIFSKLLAPEDTSLYNKLTDFLNDPLNIKYKEMFNKDLAEITTLVQEYFNNPNESLLTDYQEQIGLAFDNIREYLIYLPSEFNKSL